MADLEYGIATSNRFALLDNPKHPNETLARASEASKGSTKNVEHKEKKIKQPVPKKTNKPQRQMPEGYRPQQNGRGGTRGGRGARAHGEHKPPRMQGSDGATPNDAKNSKIKVSAESRDWINYKNFKREQEKAQAAVDQRAHGNRGNGRGGRGRGWGQTRTTADKTEDVWTGKEEEQWERPTAFHRSGRGYRGNGRVGRGQGRGRTGPAAERTPAVKHEGDSGKKQPELEYQNDTDKTESEKDALPSKDEEPKELTLDEWKALQDQQRVKTTFNIRKGGEGVDSSQWKKGVAYQKNQAVDKEEELRNHVVESNRRQHKNVAVDMKISFSDQERFGGRGGFRGRGGRRGGFNRHESNQNKACEVQPPCIEDETAFPSLRGPSK